MYRRKKECVLSILLTESGTRVIVPSCVNTGETLSAVS